MSQFLEIITNGSRVYLPIKNVLLLSIKDNTVRIMGKNGTPDQTLENCTNTETIAEQFSSLECRLD